MTHLQTSPYRPEPRRLTPAEQAVEMRARADEALDPRLRAYWLWLAEEWEKTADRERHRPALRSWADE